MKSIPYLIGAVAIAALAYEVRRITLKDSYLEGYSKGRSDGRAMERLDRLRSE